MISSEDLKSAFPDFYKKMEADKYLPEPLKKSFLKEVESWNSVLLSNKGQLKKKIIEFGRLNKMKSTELGNTKIPYGHCMCGNDFKNFFDGIIKRKTKKGIHELDNKMIKYQDEFFRKEFDEQKSVITGSVSFYPNEKYNKWCFSENELDSHSISLPIVDNLHARQVFPRLAIKKDLEWIYKISVWISFKNTDGDIDIKKPTIFDGGTNAIDGNWIPGGYTVPEDFSVKGVPEYTFKSKTLCMNHVFSKLVRAKIL